MQSDDSMNASVLVNGNQAESTHYSPMEDYVNFLEGKRRTVSDATFAFNNEDERRGIYSRRDGGIILAINDKKVGEYSSIPT